MGRRRRASLWNEPGKGKTGVRYSRGKRMPGYYARFSDYAADGSRIQRSVNFLKFADCKEWVKRYNARQDLEMLGRVIPVGLRDAQQQFLAACGALSRDTRTQYSAAISFLRATVGDNTAVGTIDGADLDRFVSERRAESSDATAAKHLRGLNRFFEWCLQQNYCSVNPVQNVTAKPRTEGVRDRPPISDADLAKIVAACDTEDRRLAVWLAMTSGLDADVIRNLKAEQIDFDAKCIRLRRPKTKKLYPVPVHAEVLSELQKRACRLLPCQPLLSGLGYRRWWKNTLKRAGLSDKIWFRDLRAVASSYVQRVGKLTLAEAQKILGHSSVVVTSRHYTMLPPSTVEQFHGMPLPGREASPEPKTD